MLRTYTCLAFLGQTLSLCSAFVAAPAQPDGGALPAKRRYVPRAIFEVKSAELDMIDGDPAALQIDDEPPDNRLRLLLNPAIEHLNDVPVLAPLSGADSSNLCEDTEFAGAELYLLGAAKCGTTSMAKDLGNAGIPSNVWPRKESHFFDDMLWFGNDMNRSRAIRFYRRIINEAELGRCPTERRVVAEMTPDNFRNYYLPQILQDLYSPSVNAKLKFVIMLREPMARIVSGFLFKARKDKQFRRKTEEEQETMTRQYVDRCLAKAKTLEANPTPEENPQAVGLDFRFYASQYGAQLRQWRKVYDPDQFFIVPKSYYFGNYRAKFFEVLSAWLQVEPLAVPPGTHINRTPHRSAQQILAQDTVTSFNEWIKPDVDSFLAQMTADWPRGMRLANYTGAAGDAEATERWLRAGW